MQEASKASLGGDRDGEDMQDYLARMNKQLEEMQSHFQNVAPRRESLARATERYLQRKASAADTGSAAGQTTAANASLSARPSVCRRDSDDAHGQIQPTHIPRQVKHQSDCGMYPASAAVEDPAALTGSSSGLAEPSPMVYSSREAAPATPPRPLSKESSWEPHSEQAKAPPQLQQQSSQCRAAMFHSPQHKRTSCRGISEPGSRRVSRAGSARLAAAFEAAAACAEEVEGSRVCIVSRNASEAGSRAGSRIPSFKWQQPTPSTTPEKTGGRDGKQRPPRSRAVSQGGHSQQQLATAVSDKLAASGCSRLPGLFGSSSSPNSRASSRSNSARFASTGGAYSSRTADAGMLEHSSNSSSAAIADPSSPPAAPAATAPPDRSCHASLDEVHSEHELLAVIHDAMEAATAAVNKPEVLTSSPRLRRFTADDVGGSSSPGAAGLGRQGSSLKGLAAAAAGWGRADDVPSTITYLAEERSGAWQQQRPSCDHHQQQAGPQKQQLVLVQPEGAGDVSGITDCSITDISGSEFVCQGSVTDDGLEEAALSTAESAQPEDVVSSTTALSSAPAAAAAGANTADAPEVAAATTVAVPYVTEASVTSAEDVAADCPLQSADLPGSQECAATTSSSSPWRRVVLEPGSKWQQETWTPTKQQQCSVPHAHQQQQQQQQQRWDTPPRQQQQQSGTPTTHHQSWSPTKQLKQLKSWFSEVRRSPGKQGSPIQQPRHASDSGVAVSAAAAAGAQGHQHSRVPSTGSLLGGMDFGSHLEDLPLHLLGQSGSARSRSSAGSHVSNPAAAAVDRVPGVYDSVGRYSSNARSNDGSSSSRSQREAEMQQPAVTADSSRVVPAITPSPAVAVYDHSTAHSQPLPRAVYDLISPQTTVTATASADSAMKRTVAAAAGPPANMQSSAPCMLQTSATDGSEVITSSSVEAAEQDDVLFGSPAGSPASSYAQLQFASKNVGAAAASRFSIGSAAVAVATAAAAAAAAGLMTVLADGDTEQQDVNQLQQQAGAAVEVDASCLSDTDADMVSPSTDAGMCEPSVHAHMISNVECEQITVENQVDGGNDSTGSSFDISTSLSSSSGIDHGSSSSIADDQMQALLQQTAGTNCSANGRTQPLAAAAKASAYKASLSREASLVDEDPELKQQMLSEQLACRQQQPLCSAAAAMGLALGDEAGKSFWGPEVAEGSGEIVVEGHSMQLPEFAAFAAARQLGAAEEAAGAPPGPLQPLQQQGEPQVQQEQQQQRLAWQSQLEPRQQQAALPALNFDSGTAASTTTVTAAGATAKPSWSERMLGKLTAALKSGSGRQRVKGVDAAEVAPVSAPTDTAAQGNSAGAAVVGDVEVEHQQQQQQQQQWHILDDEVQPPGHQLQGQETATAGASVQPPQMQRKDSVPGFRSTGRTYSQADHALTLQLARAAVVAVAGVGVAAVQGTPAPHLVSCGSTLHAPTLAAVSFLLASSSYTSNSSSSSSSDRYTPVLAAAAAASLAVAAAALVAAWELEGVDLTTLSASQASMHASTAAAAKQAENDKGAESVSHYAHSHIRNADGQLLAPGDAGISDHSSSPPRGPATAATGHNHGHTSPGFKVELSSHSSTQMSGLPELVADVSKAQYSRPGTADYDAGRYTEPVSPLHADSRAASGALTDTSPGAPEQQQQQQQQKSPWRAPDRGEHCQQQAQQLPQHRKQLSGASWSGGSSPRAAANIVWLPHKTDHWDAAQQQQQQHVGQTAGPPSAPGSGRAVSAVLQLKQRQLNRRSSIGASSSVGGSPATGDTAGTQALYQHQPQQQQQQVPSLQHQLPSDGQGVLCLGHGVMGEPIQQQQQQWHSQSQQQQPSPRQELSCTDYYRQLIQQQQDLDRHRQQQQQQNSRHSNRDLPDGSRQHNAASATSVSLPAADSSAGAGGARATSALAKLRQQRQQRASQQTSFKGEGASSAAAAMSSSTPANMGEWGSAGGVEQEHQQQWQQQENPADAHPMQYQIPSHRIPAVRAAWGDAAAPAAEEYLQQQQGSQQMQHQRRSRQEPNCKTSSTSEAAAALSSGGRGSSTDTGAGYSGTSSAAGFSNDAGGSGGSKPFLKRKSRTIVSQKLDWSSVQSRTVHKLDDRCILPAKNRAASKPSYDPALAAARSRAGLMYPGAKAATAAHGSAGRAGKKGPQAGYEPGYDMEIRSSTYYRPDSKGTAAGMGPAGPASGGQSRGRSPAAAAAGSGAVGGYSSRQGIDANNGYAAAGALNGAGGSSPLKGSGSFGQRSGVQRQLSGRSSSGGGGFGGFGDAGLNPEAPLDDLLSHVNSLIKEFDRMYK